MMNSIQGLQCMFIQKHVEVSRWNQKMLDTFDGVQYAAMAQDMKEDHLTNMAAVPFSDKP